MSFIRSTIIVAIICLLFGISAQAVGIGVKPQKLDLSVKVGKVTKTEILIMNVASQPAMYQIYPDSLSEEITVSPSDFKLNPNANQIVEIEIKIKRPGLFATNISAVARPLGSGGLVTGSGVKIPITINANGLPVLWIVLMVLLVVCLILIFIVILLYKKKGNFNP